MNLPRSSPLHAARFFLQWCLCKSDGKPLLVWFVRGDGHGPWLAGRR